MRASIDGVLGVAVKVEGEGRQVPSLDAAADVGLGTEAEAEAVVEPGPWTGTWEVGGGAERGEEVGPDE